ncbi:MAG: biotin/lipoyl-binding protein [Candidatus Kapabacteria bacterium]|jgi:glutaconyl-CoA/methylmalonyl-CoA decarboxylase subunit gamma|nr:biotin/lipoyl-binding protein [Candidatus Kapabacteria bacterium]
MKKLRIAVDGKQYDVEVEILEDDENNVLPSYYNQTAPVNVAPRAAAPAAAAAAAAPRAKKTPTKAAGENELTSPINGVVLEIPTKAGQTVAEGEVVIVLEAMKMKTNISSPKAGEIASINVSLGDRVEAGQSLVTFK